MLGPIYYLFAFTFLLPISSMLGDACLGWGVFPCGLAACAAGWASLRIGHALAPRWTTTQKACIYASTICIAMCLCGLGMIFSTPGADWLVDPRTTDGVSAVAGLTMFGLEALGMMLACRSLRPRATLNPELFTGQKTVPNR